MDALYVGLLLIIFALVCYKVGKSGQDKIWQLYMSSLRDKRQLFDKWFSVSKERDILRKDVDDLQNRWSQIPYADALDDYDDADYWKHGKQPPEWGA